MSNWQKVTLDKLCFFEKGKTGLAKAIPGDYPLVTTSAERKTNDSYQFDTKAVCIPLVSSTGHGHASLNYVHYQEGKFALGTILVALIPKDETILNAQFLHLYLSRLKDIILVPLMSGAANVSLSISKIKTVEIPLPPIDEQLKIVELFKNLVNENNELVEEINTQQSLLKQLKQTILQEAIEGKLTAKWRAKNPDIGTAKELLDQIKTEKEQLVKDKKIKASKLLAPINEDEIPFDIPPSWEWCKFGEIIYENPRNGYSPKTVDYKTEIKTLKLGAITQGYFDTTQIKYLDISIEKDSFLWLKKGDVLIQRSNSLEHVGMAGIYNLKDTNYIYPDLIMKCQVVQPVINYFIHKYLVSNFTREYFRNNASGAQQSMPKINQGTVTNLLVPLPPTEEQKEIVATIEKLFAICDELEGEINQNKTTVDNLIATVLKEAFI